MANHWKKIKRLYKPIYQVTTYCPVVCTIIKWCSAIIGSYQGVSGKGRENLRQNGYTQVTAKPDRRRELIEATITRSAGGLRRATLSHVAGMPACRQGIASTSSQKCSAQKF
jgi:hypothetical protein